MNNRPIKTDYFSLTPNDKIYYELRCSSSSSSNTSTKVIMIMGAYATLRLFDEGVDHLMEHFQLPIEVLTYDHRNIGHSKTSTTTISTERQTSRTLAQDAYKLINHVWNDQTPVHVLGISLGGMVAQELAVLLIPEQRLASLFVGLTMRGSYIRPMALLPKWVFSRIILPYFAMKPDNEQMLRSITPLVFSGIEKEELEELFKVWLVDCNRYYIFNDIDGCSNQNLVFLSHYLTNEHAQMIRDSHVPITVQISMQDKLIPPRKQQELAEVLNAKTVIMEKAGHVFNKENQLKFSEAFLEHIQNAT